MNDKITKRTELCELRKKFMLACNYPVDGDIEILMSDAYMDDWMISGEEPQDILRDCVTGARMLGCSFRIGDFDYDLMIRRRSDHSEFVIKHTTSEVP